jgi:hypothetical protein
LEKGILAGKIFLNHLMEIIKKLFGGSGEGCPKSDWDSDLVDPRTKFLVKEFNFWTFLAF